MRLESRGNCVVASTPESILYTTVRKQTLVQAYQIGCFFVTAWIICTNLVFCEFMRGLTRFILSSGMASFCLPYVEPWRLAWSEKTCMFRVYNCTLPKLLNLFNGPHGMGSYLGGHSKVGIWKWALWVINLLQKQFAKVYFRGIATGDNFVRDLKTIPWMALHSHSKVS